MTISFGAPTGQTPEAIAAAVRAPTRLVIVCNPDNIEFQVVDDPYATVGLDTAPSPAENERFLSALAELLA